MRNFNFVKGLFLAVGLMFCMQTAFGQSVSTTIAKQEHQNTLDDHYDMWKRTEVSQSENGSNNVVTSATTNGFTTYTIQLGWNFVDSGHATTYENKIASQPGVSNVSVDESAARVTYTVKEDDEHNSLFSYFDIY